MLTISCKRLVALMTSSLFYRLMVMAQSFFLTLSTLLQPCSEIFSLNINFMEKVNKALQYILKTAQNYKSLRYI